MAKPVVSVIIANYNAGLLLTRAVKSVINFPRAEVIVADNASTDSSLTDLKKNVRAPNLVYLGNSSNLGFGRAVNAAARKAEGDYLLLLNPDASLTSSALTRLIQTARSYGDHAIIVPRLVNPGGAPQPSCYARQSIWHAVQEYWFGQKGAYSKFLPQGRGPQRVHAAVAAVWLMPRQVWDELHGFSSRYFLYFEDLDFCERAYHNRIPVIYEPRAIATHHHGVSATSNPLVQQLYLQSAVSFNGRLKQSVLNFIIRSSNLFAPPLSAKKLAGIIVSYMFFVLTLTSIGYFLLPSRLTPSPIVPSLYHSNFIFWSWANFDGEHYLRIARDGYQTIMGQSEYAFFPLFPLLIRFISQTGLDPYLSAHLLTLSGAFGFVLIVVKWAQRYLPNPLTLLWITLLSPGAIYLLAIYTEPLFLFLAALTFYWADKQKWSYAIVAAALATATRFNGIFLVLFLFIKMKSNRVKTLLGLSGLVAYMLYLYAVTGNPLTWFLAQKGWQKSEPTWPWTTLSNYSRALTIDFSLDLTHLVVAVEVFVTTILLYLLVHFWRFRKINPAYKWYALGSLVLPLATGSLGSMPRFSLTLFPLFLVIPTLPRVPRILICTIFVISCMLGIILFTRGYWYA